jgi:fumarate reductase subunit C
MAENLEAEEKTYTLYHPRWYRPRVSTYWWLGSWPYSKFILRELSSIFVAWTVVLMLLTIAAVERGPQAWANYLAFMRNPLMVAINVIGFFFVVFHTITWFNLTPHAMVVRIRGQRVPGLMLSGPNYVLWIVISAVVVWLLMR